MMSRIQLENAGDKRSRPSHVLRRRGAALGAAQGCCFIKGHLFIAFTQIPRQTLSDCKRGQESFVAPPGPCTIFRLHLSRLLLPVPLYASWYESRVWGEANVFAANARVQLLKIDALRKCISRQSLHSNPGQIVEDYKSECRTA
jgi:hypothetical protein